VLANTRQRGLGQAPVVEMFMSYAQNMDRGVNLMVRTSGDPLALSGAVRDAMREVDALVPTPEFQAMEDVVRETIALPRLYSAFFAFFAGVALLLAAVGIYGLTAYAVGQRRQEIGVRMALGARAGDVVGMIVLQSLAMTAIGVGIGLVAAWLLSRPINALLFEVSARDVAVFAGVPTLLACVALVASWVPARRAAGIDPLRALRAD
jgi:ABC-type antimicrobial peptide transport system permease subunit